MTSIIRTYPPLNLMTDLNRINFIPSRVSPRPSWSRVRSIQMLRTPASRLRNHLPFFLCDRNRQQDVKLPTRLKHPYHSAFPSVAGGCGYHSHSGSSHSFENSILSNTVPVLASVSKKQNLHVPFLPFQMSSIAGLNPLSRISLLRSSMGMFLQSKAMCWMPS